MGYKSRGHKASDVTEVTEHTRPGLTCSVTKSL